MVSSRLTENALFISDFVSQIPYVTASKIIHEVLNTCIFQVKVVPIYLSSKIILRQEKITPKLINTVCGEDAINGNIISL